MSFGDHYRCTTDYATALGRCGLVGCETVTSSEGRGLETQPGKFTKPSLVRVIRHTGQRGIFQALQLSQLCNGDQFPRSWDRRSTIKGVCKMLHSNLIGSLHDTVRWYKICHAGWQKNATASKTKRFPPAKRDFSLFWMSHCVACHPAGQILYHVTASCKGPIVLVERFSHGASGLITVAPPTKLHRWRVVAESVVKL